MIPYGLSAIYSFLALVTPGLVYQLLRERARPALKEGAFREASRIALTSTILTTASIATLALIGALKPDLFIDLSDWMRSGNSYVADNTRRVAGSIVATVVLACVYAWVLHRFIHAGEKRKKGPIARTDVWYQMFTDDVPENHVPWVLIHTDKGVKIWGHVTHYTIGEALEDREVSLSGPNLTIQYDKNKVEERYWQRIWVPASRIEYMKVAYELRAAAVSETYPPNSTSPEHSVEVQSQGPAAESAIP